MDRSAHRCPTLETQRSVHSERLPSIPHTPHPVPSLPLRRRSAHAALARARSARWPRPASSVWAASPPSAETIASSCPCPLACALSGLVGRSGARQGDGGWVLCATWSIKNKSALLKKDVGLQVRVGFKILLGFPGLQCILGIFPALWRIFYVVNPMTPPESSDIWRFRFMNPGRFGDSDS